MPRKSKKDEQVQAELAALGQQDYVPASVLEIDGPTQGITLKYDYGEIDDPALRARARDAAMDINMRRHRAALDIITIGQKLLEIQSQMPKQFRQWIETEFEYSEGTANEYMNVARRFSHMPELVSDVPTTVLRIMASPTLPDDGVQAILNAHDDALDLGTVLKGREAEAIADQFRPDENKRPRRERIARTIATNYSVQKGDDALVKTLLENPGDENLAHALREANKEQLQKALSQLPPDDTSRRQVLEYALQEAESKPPHTQPESQANGTGFQAPAISTRRKDGVLVELPRVMWGKILEAFRAFDMNPTISDKDALKIVKLIEQSLETQ